MLSTLSYPGGLPAIALLLLRLATAALLIFLPQYMGLNALWAWVPVLIGTLGLATGFVTRAIAILVFLASLIALALSWEQANILLPIAAVNALALGLLGPGSLSIDAHRHGRRVVNLDR